MDKNHSFETVEEAKKYIYKSFGLFLKLLNDAKTHKYFDDKYDSSWNAKGVLPMLEKMRDAGWITNELHFYMEKRYLLVAAGSMQPKPCKFAVDSLQERKDGVNEFINRQIEILKFI